MQTATDRHPRIASVEMRANVIELPICRPAQSAAMAQPMRCVSSGYMRDGASCRNSIPADVVTAEWARHRRAGVVGDRFFRFSWHGELWLGYGRADGTVRGVYCPSHAAERDRRSASVILAGGGCAPASDYHPLRERLSA